MSDHKIWESHPEFETIKKYANFIDKELDKDGDSKLKKYIQATATICEYYHYLEEKKFIEALPFYDKQPKGIREGVSIVLPSYAFKDYLTSNIVTNLSNILDNHNVTDQKKISEDEASNAIRELIETIKKYFCRNPFFKELSFISNETDTTVGLIIKSGFSYEVINQTFSNKAD